MKSNILLIAMLLLGLSAQAANAQGDDRAGTAAASYLLVPTTARTSALGNTLTGGLNTLSGIEALTSNPAALMSNSGTSALFSRTNYVADIGINHFGIAQSVGNGNNIALTVTAWDFGDIPEIDGVEITDPTAQTYSASTIIVGASYARSFTDRISAGVTSKFITESIDDVSGSTVAFDAGMTYSVGESGLQFGVSLRNFGGKLSFGGNGLRTSDGGVPITYESEAFELPSLLNFGASYTRQFAGDVSVTALGNFRSNAYDQAQYAGGLELGYANLIYVRGGMEIIPDSDQTFYQGWSVGGGLNLNLAGTGVGVDYGYRATDFFDGVHMFTANVSL